jgi:uncharacterized membrane protein
MYVISQKNVDNILKIMKDKYLKETITEPEYFKTLKTERADI